MRVLCRFKSCSPDSRWLEAHTDGRHALNVQVVGANPSKPVAFSKENATPQYRCGVFLEDSDAEGSASLLL